MDLIRKYIKALGNLAIVLLVLAIAAIIASLYIIVTWGAPLLFLIAYKRYKQNKRISYIILSAFVCVLSGYYLLSTDSIREYPLIFRFGIIGIFISTIFVGFAIVLFYYSLKEKKVFNLLQFIVIAALSIICIAILEYKFEKRYESSKLLVATSEQYDNIIIEEKRRRYMKQFCEFRNTHSKFRLKEYLNFSKYIDNGNRYIKDPRDYYLEDIDSSYSGDLIIFHLGSSILELNFKLEHNLYENYISMYCSNNFIEGFDVSYQNGEIKGRETIEGTPFVNYCDEKTEYARRNSGPVFKQLLIRAFVIEDNIDEYYKFRPC